ncbi:MAG: anti-sigma factor family protein [Candidatus Binataceae bacterium]
MLSAYVDGQLETNEELEVRRHLDGCAHCFDLLESLSALNEAVASTAELHPVPHSLRERVNQMRASKRASKLVWSAVAIAAALLVTFSLAYWNRRSRVSAVDQLTQALLEDHLRYLNIPDAIQVASDDPRRHR